MWPSLEPHHLAADQHPLPAHQLHHRDVAQLGRRRHRLLHDRQVHQLRHIPHSLRPDGRVVPHVHPKHRDGVHVPPGPGGRHRRPLRRPPRQRGPPDPLRHHGHHHLQRSSLGIFILVLDQAEKLAMARLF